MNPEVTPDSTQPSGPLQQSGRKPTVSMALIDDLCAGGRDKGLNMAELFAEIGLEPDSLKRKRFPAHKVDHLTQLLKEQLQDESLGFFDRQLKPGSHEYSCRSSINSRNLREAFVHISNFFNLVTDDMYFELQEDGNEARLILDYANPKQLNGIVFLALVILTYHRWGNWLTGKKVLLSRLHVAFDKPSYADEYANMFSCEHRFNQPTNMIVFDRKALDLPVIQTMDNLQQVLPEFPQDLVARLRLDNSVSAQVQRMLQSGKEYEGLTLAEVAGRLNISTDTLRRRLKEEGNSYAEIKERLRRNAALFWLTSTQMPINSIALRLGFSEPSAFNRAFKNWTGVTPGQYRAGAV